MLIEEIDETTTIHVTNSEAGNLRERLQDIELLVGSVQLIIDDSTISKLGVDLCYDACRHGPFFDCHSLLFVDLSACIALVKIGNFAFMRCSGMKTIEFPSKLEVLGWGVFMQCTSLTGVTLPHKLKQVREFVGEATRSEATSVSYSPRFSRLRVRKCRSARSLVRLFSNF